MKKLLRSLLAAIRQPSAEGGHVTPRESGDDIPAMLSPGRPAEEATHEEATMHISDPVADWCPACLKTSLLRHDIVALVSDGPHRIGEYAICHECAHSPYATPAQAAEELARETQDHEALDTVLYQVADWLRRSELGLSDTGDLVWELQQVGHPLPRVPDEDLPRVPDEDDEA